MSKRKVDPADVLVNRLNLGLAKHNRLLASWSSGLAAGDAKPGSASKIEERDEDDDIRDPTQGHEQLGVGGIVPKHIQDGSFTRGRPMTSDDKLLQQLIGKKAAKAHIIAREAAKLTTKAQQSAAKPVAVVKKEESEDEEEGRAARFKSKRRKTGKQTLKVVDADEDTPETSGVDIPVRPASSTEDTPEKTPDAAPNPILQPKPISKDSDSDADEPSSNSRGKPKGGSYLDELLAERSKKKKNKQKNKQTAS